MVKNEQEKLLHISEVLSIIPIGKSTFYAWIQAGKAPQPIRFGTRCSMWRYSEIINFIENQSKVW
ncbi:TPA: AlpA family phage regulatory protein [Providencia stuartii]|nr:AlpA family phage regulatory protein [Providencia stuartii]